MGGDEQFSKASLFVVILLFLALPSQGSAQDASSNNSAASPPRQEDVSIFDRPGLVDGPGSPLEKMRDHGVGLSVTYTEYGQGMVSGEGNHEWQFGGKFMGKLNLDGEKLHLWHGFSINAIGEYTQGQNVDDISGTLLPVNTALYGPGDGRPGGDLSLTFKQQFTKRFSITAGKFNMYEAPSRTPILGGGGIDGFWNLAFAAPFTGVVPPYIAGFTFAYNTAPVQIAVMLYSADSAQQQTGLKNWGKNGVNTRAAVTLPIKLAGRTGYQIFTFVGSSKTGTDFADIPQLILPPQSRPALGTKTGSFYGAYSFQQYIWQDAHNPNRGWGVFGQIGIADQNPNPLSYMMIFGASGTGVMSRRPLDRFGVGYLRYQVSHELVTGFLALGLNFGAEQGAEAYYTLAATPWLRITGDFQVLAPGNHDLKTVCLAGLSTQVRF